MDTRGKGMILLAKDMPKPTKGREVVLDQLIEDLKTRSEFGEQKYGTKLMTHNSRCAMTDAFHEVLDLSMYLKQALMEKKDSEMLMAQILVTLKACYQYQVLEDDTYGYTELEELLCDTLCNLIGPDGFTDWLDSLNPDKLEE